MEIFLLGEIILMKETQVEVDTGDSYDDQMYIRRMGTTRSGGRILAV